MNTREIAQLQHWDEGTLAEMVGRYVRTFRRLPSHSELVRFRNALERLQLRQPRHSRRKPRTLIAPF